MLVGPRIARTGASERGAISSMWQRLRPAQGSFHRLFKPVLTSIRDTGPVLTPTAPVQRFGRRSRARALSLALPRPGWKSAGLLALLCSGVAWASLPQRWAWPGRGPAPVAGARNRAAFARRGDRHAHGGDRGGPAGGFRAAARRAGSADRGRSSEARAGGYGADAHPRPSRRRPLLVAPRRGRIAAGRRAISRRARDARSTSAKSTQDAGFDLVLGSGSQPSLRRPQPGRRTRRCSWCKWNATGAATWIDAANADRPQPASAGMTWPVAGHITSYFGYRYHPILHFTPLPRRRRHRRELGQPDRRRRGRPGRRARAGPAAMAARCSIAHGGGM